MFFLKSCYFSLILITSINFYCTLRTLNFPFPKRIEIVSSAAKKGGGAQLPYTYWYK